MSSSKENKSVKMDMRNVVSWLVPNDPSPKSKARGKPTLTSSKTTAIINKAKPKPPTPLASPIIKNVVDNKDDNKDDISDTSSISHSFFDPDARLWASIFSNVNRSIDQLYDLCEEENAQQRCQEAVDLMERSRVDFVKLIERIDEQEKFSTDVASNDGKNVPRAMSWEVRKPTVGRRFSPHTTSPNSSRKNSFVNSPLAMKQTLEDEGIEYDLKNNTDPLPSTGSLLAGRNNEITTKLRAAAPAFIPLPITLIKTNKNIVTNESISEIDKLIKTQQQSKSTNNLIDATNLVPVQVIIRPHSQSNLQAASSSMRPRSFSTSNLKSASSTFPSTSKQNLIKKNEKPVVKKINKDNWDAETELEVTQESEKVWREAEAWIEAEAAVEEAAWEVLFGDHLVSNSPKSAESIKNLKNQHLHNSNINYQSTSFSTAQSPSQSTQPLILFTSPMKSMSNQSSTFNSPIEKPSILSIAEKYNNSVKSNIANIDGNNLKSLESQDINKFSENEVVSNDSSISSTRMLELPEKSLVIQVQEEPSSPVSLSSPPSWSTPQSHNRSSSNSSSCGSVRSLHDKLSSPDRRRSVSPGEAKRRQEAKQLAAEYNRDRSLDERKQKALISWNRVKLHSEKEVQRLADAQQSLADRLNDAEKRHEDYIKLIKGKAGNENAKVSEVAFINSLNTEGIAQELQSKLEEIEARVLAAEMRRQERLEGITVKKKEKSCRKSMQMTALRYKLEQDKMDRWSKLQTRLNTVNQRRELRFAEIKRRHDQSTTDQSDNNSNNTISNPPIMESNSNNEIKKELSTIIEIPLVNKNINKVIKKDSKKISKSGDEIDQFLAESNKNDDENLEKALLKNSIYSDRPLVWNHIKNWKINRQKKGALNSRIAALSCVVNEVDSNKNNDVTSVLSLSSGDLINQVEGKGEISQIFIQLNKLILNSVKENNIKSIFIDVLSYMKQIIASPVCDNSSNIIDKKKKLNKSNNIFTPSFLNEIMPILEAIGDSKFGTTENKRLVANFIKNDGILLIRLLMGTEFGFLFSDDNFKIAAETGLWLNVFKVIHSCSLFSSSRDYLFQTGVSVLLVDCVFISLSHLDDWTKSSYHIDVNDNSINDTNANDTKGKKNIQVPLGKKSSSTTSIKLWPIEAKALPHQLTSINQLLRHAPISSNNPISNNIFQNIPDSDNFEAWIWYLFASNIVSMLCKQLEYLEEKISSRLSDFDFPFSLTHNLVLVISGIGSYLKLSAGIQPTTQIQSLSNLSSKRHKNSRGREMVSILRTAEIVPTLISLLGTLLFDGINGTNRRRANWDESSSIVNASTFVLCESILISLIEFASVDLTLVQLLPHDSKLSITYSASRIIHSLTTALANKDIDGNYILTSELKRCNFTELIINPDANNSHKNNENISSEKRITVSFSSLQMDNCLCQLFKFLGLFCLKNRSIQELISQGASPTLFMDMCRLPIRFFLNDRLKFYLLSCLSSLCLDNSSNIQLIKMELSVSLLLDFLKESCQQLSLIKNNNDNSNLKFPVDICEISQCLPIDLWQVVIDILSTN